jgi:hypothetical protein
VRQFLTAACLVAVVAALSAASQGSVTVAASPAATFYTDGTVFAVAAAPDRTYIGGSFSLIGAATGSWVAVGSEGELIPGRPPLVGVVNAAVPDGHGGWFVAGRIVGVGSVARSARVIHLTAAGGLDTRWRGLQECRR